MDLRYNPEKTPSKWVEIQNTKLTKWVTKTFSYNKSDDSSLFVQQRFVRDFIQPNSPYRGLLLYHGLGVGKTAAAIVSAEGFINSGVCVMLPASLRQNFMGEIQRYGNKIFSNQQYWTFMNKNDVSPKLLRKYKLENAKYVMKNKSGEKFKGLWIPDDTKKSNYNKMSIVNQKNIQKQLFDMISGYYNFIHYNGINKAKLISMTENNTINVFDNKFVIIDEVHNFISRVVNKSKVSLAIYDMLMNAENCKILLLSGTPLINYPHELSCILNLVRGKLEYHCLNYVPSTIDIESVKNYLDSSLYIDNHYIENNKIYINTVPRGFRYNNDSKKGLIETKNEANIGDIVKDLKKLNVKFRSNYHSTSARYLLPTDEDAFNSFFIDFENTNIMKDRKSVV